ncbi:hypothetical protein Taro_021812, partial [Colocasia esculenta]|nr:hypothetical protein [Colocasia esculenta]
MVASFLSNSCFATGCGFCVVTCWLRFSSVRCVEVELCSVKVECFWLTVLLPMRLRFSCEACSLGDPLLRAGEALLGQEELLRQFSGRFDALMVFLACSHREDVVWSGGNAERSPVFAFFVKTLPSRSGRDRSTCRVKACDYDVSGRRVLKATCGTVEVNVVFLDTVTPELSCVEVELCSVKVE